MILTARRPLSRRQATDSVPFSTILLPIGDPCHAKKAIAAACDLASRSAGEIVVLHVREMDPFSGSIPEADHDALCLVDSVVRRLRRRGARARAQVMAGRREGVTRTIVEAARGFSADLVVLGLPSHPVINESAFPDEVAHRVLQTADCPVLIVH